MTKASKKRKSRRNAVKYPGALAEPIYEPVLFVGMLGDDTVERTQALQRAELRRLANLPDLFRFYNIDPKSADRWLFLALRLAEDHVPGMRITLTPNGKSGRPNIWKFGLGTELLRDVETVRAEKGLNITDALDQLQKDKGKQWYSLSDKSIGTRYREARRDEELWQRIAKSLGASLDISAMPQEPQSEKPALNSDENS